MAGKKIVGVLALQGAFAEHQAALQRCGAEALPIRRPDQLSEIDGLIIPGGESTAIGKLMNQFGIDSVIKERSAQGMPIWGTCAGMILLAKELEDAEQFRLGLMDIKVKRNAFGRQVDSFEADLQIEGVGRTRGVFIRAPYAEKTWGSSRVLARFRDKIVMVQQDHLLSTAFHPELTDQEDLHRYFIEMI